MERLSFVVLGPHRCGKSTIIAQILHKYGEVDQRKLDKFEKESYELGRQSKKFAWVTDQTKEEREWGRTMSTLLFGFTTKHREYTCVSVPGHPDFVRNTIYGIHMAQSVVLTVDEESFRHLDQIRD